MMGIAERFNSDKKSAQIDKTINKHTRSNWDVEEKVQLENKGE